MKKPWTKYLIDSLKYVVGFALLAYVIWSNWATKFDPDSGEVTQPGLDQLVNRVPDGGCIALTMVLAVSLLLTQYLRWFVLVRAVDLPFTVRNALRLGLVGTFYNMFLPGAIGGDIAKALFIIREQPERKAAAVATIFADRLIGLFGMLLFGAVLGGGAWLLGNPTLQNDKLQLIVLIGTGLCSIGAIGYLAIGWVKPAASDRFQTKLSTVKWAGRLLSELWFTVRQYRQKPAAVLSALGLSLLATGMMVAAFHFGVRIFPPADTALLGEFSEHFVICPIGFIAQAIIPLPGGIGVAEWSFGGLYTLIRGLEGKAVGLVGRLSLRLVEWCIGLSGYVVFLTMKKELPVPADAEPPADLSAAMGTPSDLSAARGTPADPSAMMGTPSDRSAAADTSTHLSATTRTR